ncbi:Na+/H+ antiporter NhaA [Streptomyces spinosirectus]
MGQWAVIVCQATEAPETQPREAPLRLVTAVDTAAVQDDRAVRTDGRLKALPTGGAVALLGALLAALILYSGPMSFFFLLVGLEAREELDLGELRDRRLLLLPAGAGMVAMAVRSASTSPSTTPVPRPTAGASPRPPTAASRSAREGAEHARVPSPPWPT